MNFNKTRKFSKKIFSMIISLAMVLSVIPTVSFAESGAGLKDTAGTSKWEVELVPYKAKDTNIAKSPADLAFEDLEPTTKEYLKSHLTPLGQAATKYDKNTSAKFDTFFIGVKLRNTFLIQEAKMGLTSITFAFNFDPSTFVINYPKIKNDIDQDAAAKLAAGSNSKYITPTNEDEVYHILNEPTSDDAKDFYARYEIDVSTADDLASVVLNWSAPDDYRGSYTGSGVAPGINPDDGTVSNDEDHLFGTAEGNSNEEFIAMIPIKISNKVTANSAIPDGTKIAEIYDPNEQATYFSARFGYGQDEATYDYDMIDAEADNAMTNVAKFIDSAMKVYPPLPQFITLEKNTSEGWNGTVGNQYTDNSLNTTDYAFNGTTNTEPGVKVHVPLGSVKFYYANNTGITQAQVNSLATVDDTTLATLGLTHVPESLTTALSGKYLYAVCAKGICEVGAITVTEEVISSLAAPTTSGTLPTNAKQGQSILDAIAESKIANIVYNSGKKIEDCSVTDLASSNFDIYTVVDGKIGAVVDSDSKFAGGTNNFVVAADGLTAGAAIPTLNYQFSISAQSDTITALQSIYNTSAAVTYGSQNATAAGMMTGKIVKVTSSALYPSGKDMTFAEALAAGITVYITDKKTSTKTAVTADSTSVLVPDEYTVSFEAGTVKSTVASGKNSKFTIGKKNVNLTFTPNADTTKRTVTKEYDKANTATVDTTTPQFTVSIPAADLVTSADKTAAASATISGITYQYAKADGTATVKVAEAAAIKAVPGTITSSSTDLNSKYNFQVTAGQNGVGTGSVVTGITGTITAKKITVAADTLTPPSVKVGDSATGSIAEANAVAVPSGILDGDTVKLTYSYEYTNGTTATANGTAPVNITNLALVGTDSANYALTSTTTTAKGTVTDKVASGIQISGTAPTTNKYGAVSLDGVVVTVKNGTASDDTYTIGTNALPGEVKLYTTVNGAETEVVPGTTVLKTGSYDIYAKYSKGTSNFSSKDAAAGKTISVTIGKAIVEVTGAFPGAKDKDYDGTRDGEMDGTAPTVKKVQTTDDIGVKVTYTFADKNAADGKTVAVTYELTGEDKGNYDLPTSDANFITSCTADIAPIALTINDVTVSSALKGDDSTKSKTGVELTITDSNSTGLVSGDEVTLKYDYEYDDISQETESGAAAVTVTNDSLTGTDAGNYTYTKPTFKGTVTANALDSITEVDTTAATLDADGNVDLSGLKVTVSYGGDDTATYESLAAVLADGFTVVVTDSTGAEVTLTDGKFASAKGTYTVKVSKDDKDKSGSVVVPAIAKTPELANDNATNGIKVTNPEAGAVYAIVAKGAGAPADDDTAWVTLPADGVLGTNLAQDTEYDVYVKIKTTAPTIASPAKSATQKTYPNKITVKKSASDTVVKTVYTDATSITDYNDFKTKTNTTISGYGTKMYSDKDAKIEVTSSAPVTVGADTTIYMKKASTGGGGGGSTGTIKFDKSNATMTVGEKLKITATKSTNLKNDLVWTSSDDKIATVDKDGNITAVSAGVVTITAEANGVTKTATITVKPGAATPTPAPSAEPTAKPLIDTTYSEPYVKGYEDGSFRAEVGLTRAETAAMIARLINGSDINDGAYTASFADVPADAWYSKYIGYLENYNILTGYEDGSFLPYDIISRSEMCAIITRAQKFAVVAYDGQFSDVTDADWAKDYIATMAAHNLIQGYSADMFAPYGLLKRAEAVTIINRLLDSTSVAEPVTFNDIAGHWAENDIIIAASKREVITTSTPAPTEEPEATPEATEEPTAQDEE